MQVPDSPAAVSSAKNRSNPCHCRLLATGRPETVEQVRRPAKCLCFKGFRGKGFQRPGAEKSVASLPFCLKKDANDVARKEIHIIVGDSRNGLLELCLRTGHCAQAQFEERHRHRQGHAQGGLGNGSRANNDKSQVGAYQRFTAVRRGETDGRRGA